MEATNVRLSCTLFSGAFSGEAVFALAIEKGDHKSGEFEGVVPRRYVEPREGLSTEGVQGTVHAVLLEQKNGTSVVSVPSGERLYVPAEIIVRG